MPTIAQVKARLPPAERAFYDFLWTHFLKHRAWPSTWHVYRTHLEKPKLAHVLAKATYTLHSENTSAHPRSFELQALGMLVTEKGEIYRQWLTNFFVYLRDRFYAGEDSQALVTQTEVQRALNLSSLEADELGQVLRGSFLGLYPTWQPQSPGWQMYLPCHVLEDFGRSGSVSRELRTRLSTLLAQSKRKRRARSQSITLDPMESFRDSPSSETADNPRRYQVFVSSPFNDLKDERQQVVQALLEMQCFPAGMELFPAASMEQWKLIKNVINESDYYVVIVAARYGTLMPGTKRGYTEREFDYALRVGKPILAFYHSSPGKIASEKAEDSPAGRKRLQRFIEKLKTNRVCKSWSNAHDLGSAVKSALQLAFKETPRAGWTRAN